MIAVIADPRGAGYADAINNVEVATHMEIENTESLIEALSLCVKQAKENRAACNAALASFGRSTLAQFNKG